jgi:hypothetical protein
MAALANMVCDPFCDLAGLPFGRSIDNEDVQDSPLAATRPLRGVPASARPSP